MNTEDNQSTETDGIAAHYCGQTQPHAAHTWQTPPIYGATTFISTYQCAGATAEVPPGPCWHNSGGVAWPGQNHPVRCELLAGHVGAHEAEGRAGGHVVWEHSSPPATRVHNHAPYRPNCNERDVDGQLRGACLNDDGSDR